VLTVPGWVAVAVFASFEDFDLVGDSFGVGVGLAVVVERQDRGDRATNTTQVRRYQRDTPGELIHVDIKKLGGIRDGGGWKTRGRGYRGEYAKNRQGGYRCIHTAIDDRTRIAYSEILDNEQAVTAAGFWKRAAAWYLESPVSG